LRDYEEELVVSTAGYAKAIREQASDVGWLKPIDYCFTGKWAESGDVVPVPLPLAPPRKLCSFNSGQLSASALRYRRARTAYIRGLYLQLIIRTHCTEEGDCAADANVGEKRKRGSEEGAEGDPTSGLGAGATEEGGGEGVGAAGKNRCSEGAKEQRRKEAAVSAFLQDLPHVLLKLLLKDAKMRTMAIGSEKRMRKKILQEIKTEARRTRQDPLWVLETAVKMAGTFGSMRQYSILGSLLNRSGTAVNTLPTPEDVAKGKRELMEMAAEDLKLQAIPDGYRISLKRAVESEALRLMQTTRDLKKKEARVANLDPDVIPHWQDSFDVKLTFDARRVTKHCSQTEVMIIFLPKGQAGVDRCQQAVHIRTIAVWTGKDSKENVLRNLTDIVREAAELEQCGIAFSRAADSFLGVTESATFKDWLAGREQAFANLGGANFDEWLRTEESGAPAPFRRVALRFWVAADMLAQCSLIGQGCSGHSYCAHCHAHKENRHLPFELFMVEKPTNFWKLANDSDTKVETMWAINTCEDLGAKSGRPWGLTEEGLMACTLPCVDPSLSRAAAPPAPRRGPAPAAPPAPAVPPAQPPASSNDQGDVRQRKGSKNQRRQHAPAAAAAAAPVPVQEAASVSPAVNFPTGPDTAVIMRLTGWKQQHPVHCECGLCVVPRGTIVRRMIQPGFSRESEYLNTNWPDVSRGRFPFCALHCTMRITEAMFYNVCQNALAAGEPAVRRLNDAMQKIGLKSKKFQKVLMFTNEHYERLSFLGSEALLLLKRFQGSEKRNVQVLLEHLWPSGDASESREGLNFVERSIALWECWAEVVELMSERDPEKLRKQVDPRHGDGFARFGKVCREFCFRYQVLFHKTHCKSFYLHTLLAHGGDFMRALGQHGMCLGMMSNSGAERRHEYGRRAFRRSLCGGCWAKYDPELANKANMSAFLTLREILIWQYGSDLLSHERARRAAASFEEARRAAASASSSGEPPSQSAAAGFRAPQPLSPLTTANLEQHCRDTDVAEGLNQLIEPLLSPTEEAAESLRVAPMEADPAVSVLGETAREGWEHVQHDQSFALSTIRVPPEQAGGLDGRCYSGSAGEMTYDAGKDRRLTNNICDVVSDVDGEGSEDVSSDASDCSDGGGGPRFRDLAAFSESDEDEEWTPGDGDASESGDDCDTTAHGRRSSRNPPQAVGGGRSVEAAFSVPFCSVASASAGAGSPSPADPSNPSTPSTAEPSTPSSGGPAGAGGAGGAGLPGTRAGGQGKAMGPGAGIRRGRQGKPTGQAQERGQGAAAGAVSDGRAGKRGKAAKLTPEQKQEARAKRKKASLGNRYREGMRHV